MLREFADIDFEPANGSRTSPKPLKTHIINKVFHRYLYKLYNSILKFMIIAYHCLLSPN